MAVRRTTILGLLGPHKDSPRRPTSSGSRWDVWRPTVSLFMHEDFEPDRLVLLAEPRYGKLSDEVLADIRSVSPNIDAARIPISFADPWDFAEVYGVLRDFADEANFDPEIDDLLVHVTTGTHVAQICLFLLVESRHLPGRLIQSSPPKANARAQSAGSFAVIDLDLSRYDRLAARFARERRDGVDLLKAGIETRNSAFNELIERIERVALRSTDPILLCGPTGTGKTRLARRIFELKRRHGEETAGHLVEVNCATLRGDQAMSALFGHAKGAFTGAVAERAGLLTSADGGVLFLDEVGELGLDEQAMLLRAIEEKTYLPVGSDEPVSTSFQLIAGTNRDLFAEVRAGRFREDLLARIDVWTFDLPALEERPEDIEPNLDFELDRVSESLGRRVTMNREARARFLGFATLSGTRWRAGFRDFGAAITRMATLADGGRITGESVRRECDGLEQQWNRLDTGTGGFERWSDRDLAARALGKEAADALDRFDRVQLEDVLSVCRRAPTLSAAGRELFARSRERKASGNDADRLRKYLARFGLVFSELEFDGEGAASRVGRGR